MSASGSTNEISFASRLRSGLRAYGVMMNVHTSSPSPVVSANASSRAGRSRPAVRARTNPSSAAVRVA
jgi:hypothetical protein